jgi:transposase
VLLSADGVGAMAIQRQTGKGKPTIWRWQARFMAEGVDGLLHDATRPGRKKPLPGTTIERVVAMTLTDPPGEATHWTGRAMAKAAGISLRSVQRIWAAHGLHAVSGPAVQTFQRRRVCSQGSGHRRPLYRPARNYVADTPTGWRCARLAAHIKCTRTGGE